MADDIQMSRTRPAALDAPAVRRPRPAIPDDPEAARAEIEATRARMSETIDEIEDVLLKKKEDLLDKIDVLAPVRERPLRSLALIFGAGLALGLVTGGGKDNDEEDEDELYEEDEFDAEAEDEVADALERADAWEDRAHRLLRIARAQEDELEIHRSRRVPLLARRHSAPDADADDDRDEDGDAPNFFDRIRETAAERISGLVSEAMQRVMRGG